MPASSHSKLQRCQLLCFFNIGINFSVENGSLYHETCNVSSLKCNQNSAETISRCCMTQILMFSGKSILFIFRRFSYKGNKVVDPTLIRGCRTPIRAVSPAILSLTSLTVTSRPCKKQVHAVEAAEYTGKVCKHHKKLFIVKLDMEVVFVFSKKNFNLVFKFINRERHLPVDSQRTISIKQKFHMLRSYFSDQK